MRKAHQAAAALEAGTVWVNCYNAFDNAAPWGGFKQSGWGREKGPYGLDLFTQIKQYGHRGEIYFGEPVQLRNWASPARRMSRWWTSTRKLSR